MNFALVQMFLTFKDSISYLEENFSFDKQTLINFFTLLQTNEQEIHNIVESCFQTDSNFELKKFIEKKK